MAVIAWSACATLALAADTGSIRGSVTDPAGVPIAGARIVLDSSAARESTASDAAGGFAFANIPAATYVITAEAKGFSP
ncbi:MAG TPA: carboxypeptidase-like regulatory domain-containing protein, partial [Labilithrix sp.]